MHQIKIERTENILIANLAIDASWIWIDDEQRDSTENQLDWLVDC